MLSLEFVLGFCHKITKGGDCKVEFNQPFCWLYFIPNLLAIKHLETLYLCGNHVRVVCERVWRKAQKCAFYRDSRLDLMSGLWLASRQKRHTCEACRGAEESCKLLHYRTKVPDWPGSKLMTWTRDSIQSQGQVTQPLYYKKNWPFTFQTHTSINTPYTHIL